MSNVIDFLEGLGHDAQLRYTTGSELERVLESADIEPALRMAILTENRRQMEALLGAKANVCCMVHVPDDDDEEEEDDSQEDEDDSQRKGDELMSYQFAARRVLTQG